MTRSNDLLDLIYHRPTLIAHDMGFDRLTELHDGWIREMTFGDGAYTLQAHRNSYKTTCLGISMAFIALLYPHVRQLFFRKTDNDVAEVMRATAQCLTSPTFQSMSNTLYGHGFKLDKNTLGEVNTTLSRGVSGASQIVGLGINGSITGKHADRIFTDDIVTLRDRLSAAERAKTDLFYQELQNIVNRGGRIFNSGTPWHKDDTFRLMPEAHVWDCYSTGIMTEDDIKSKRGALTASLFAANYELKHIADEDAIFTDARFTDNPEKLFDGIAHIDASYGGSDGTALTCLKCGRTGDWFAYIRLWQKPVDAVLDEILGICKGLRCAPVYMERNADKGYVAKQITDKGYKARTYHEHENKFVKITTYLKGAWSRLYLLDCKRWPLDEGALSQIHDYTQEAEHDDMPDSLASAVRAVSSKARFKGFEEGI